MNWASSEIVLITSTQKGVCLLRRRTRNSLPTCNCAAIVGIQESVDFVEEIKRTGIAFLHGENKCECDNRLLTSRQLLHLAQVGTPATKRHLNKKRMLINLLLRKELSLIACRPRFILQYVRPVFFLPEFLRLRGSPRIAEMEYLYQI